ncbi:hypothetical protein SCHPADRAFT_896749 [Schizopora paradoxa]|uniref:F-box domain-containing protein n=1 Tax=Schizopora paradoxa TaxID=27342 RepID=A0A0H2RJ02_9AGAM|nr:hypothetical protein SCHPADRAFT_896749 [Schizopora paradoxa]
MPSTPRNDFEVGCALSSFERMATKSIMHPGCRNLDDWDCDFQLESWSRLRTNRLRGDVDSGEVSHLFRDANLLDHMVETLDRLRTSATLLQQRTRLRLKPIISKLSLGIASLPDELLMLIFELTIPSDTGEQPERRRPRQAVLLSHVSRRFRSAALRTHYLWTTLDGYASRSELEAFVARSGNDSDLHIVLNASHTGHIVADFLDMCLPLAPRWKSISVASEGDWQAPDTVDGALSKIFHSNIGEVDERVFPRLGRLSIKRVGNIRLDVTSEKIKPRSEIPSLRQLQCDGYTPVPSPAYSSVTSFSSTISMSSASYDTDLEDLCLFLTSLRAMTDLSLTIRSTLYFQELDDSTRARCHSVTSLTLFFPFFIFSSTMRTFLRPLIGLFELPNLTDLSVSIELRMEDIRDNPEDEFNLENLVAALCPHPSTHPNLSTVRIKLSHTEENWTKGQEWSNMRSKSLRIPLQRIPHVTTLSVQSFTDVEVYGMFLPGKSDLRELHLVECRYFDVASLEKLVASLREANAWNTLDTLKMENCGHFLEYDDAVKIVGKEKLSFAKISLEDLL